MSDAAVFLDELDRNVAQTLAKAVATDCTDYTERRSLWSARQKDHS